MLAGNRRVNPSEALSDAVAISSKKMAEPRSRAFCMKFLCKCLAFSTGLLIGTDEWAGVIKHEHVGHEHQPDEQHQAGFHFRRVNKSTPNRLTNKPIISNAPPAK